MLRKNQINVTQLIRKCKNKCNTLNNQTHAVSVSIIFRRINIVLIYIYYRKILVGKTHVVFYNLKLGTCENFK